MLEVSSITKALNATLKISDITFNAKKGDIIALLGSSKKDRWLLLSILAGVNLPDKGSIIYNDVSMLRHPTKAKGFIGYLPSNPSIHGGMTLWEQLCFYSDLKKLKLPRTEHLLEILENLNFLPLADKLGKDLDLSHRQKSALAMSLIGYPPFIILDMPTSNLSPEDSFIVTDYLKTLSEERVILFSTNSLIEAQRIANRIIVMDSGKIIANTTPDIFSSREEYSEISFRVKAPLNEITEFLDSADYIDSWQSLPTQEIGSWDFSLKGSKNAEIRERLFKDMAQREWTIISLTGSRQKLESIIHNLKLKDDRREIVDKGILSEPS